MLSEIDLKSQSQKTFFLMSYDVFKRERARKESQGDNSLTQKRRKKYP